MKLMELPLFLEVALLVGTYYEEPEAFVNDLPKDDTWIVVYCACPHAASQRVVNTLKRYGYKNTAIIDEGVLVWAQMGYPVNHGQ